MLLSCSDPILIDFHSGTHFVTRSTPHLEPPRKTTFFMVSGCRRPSKTATEDTRRLPRGYLRLIGAILSHLGNKSFQDRSSRIYLCQAFEIWAHIRFLTGAPNYNMFYLFGVICWTCFWLTFGPHVGPCRDQIGPRMGQDGSKTAMKSFKDPKPIKTCISKKLANIRFCYVFGGQGRPRQPQKAKEGSPEAPEDLQNRKQKGSKHGPKNDNMFEKVWGNLGEYFGDRICSREKRD